MRGVLAAVVGALVVAASAGAAATPTLALQSLHPFVVHGSGFRPHVRVRVTLTSPTITAKRSRRTTASGRFSVDFGSVLLGRCAGYTVRAIGPNSQVATLKRTPLPACMP